MSKRLPLFFMSLFAAVAPAQDVIPLPLTADFQGWRIEGARECWTLSDGVIVGKNNAQKSGSILWTSAALNDFVFSCEYKLSEGGDSGVFLREENEQIQLGVSRSLKVDMSGAPYIATKKGYPVAAVGVSALLKSNDWNRLEITVRGAHYVVIMNDKQVLDFISDRQPLKSSGPVGLQIHPGVEMEVQFRHMSLKSLPPVQR